IVCRTLAKPSTQRAQAGRRVSHIPMGRPIPTANSMAQAVNQRCSKVKKTISRPCCARKAVIACGSVERLPHTQAQQAPEIATFLRESDWLRLSPHPLARSAVQAEELRRDHASR